jgi:ParB-like chromosome segregation protein Spo0J
MSRGGIESLEGVTKKGFYMLPPQYLRFYPGNIRIDYGFESVAVLPLVQRNVQVLGGHSHDLSQEEFDFVLSSLGDPTDTESMAWLVDSIDEGGIQQPLRGYKEGDFFISTDGNRRTAALVVLALMGKELPARVPIRPETYRNEFDLLAVQVVSNSGKKLSALDEARIYDRALKLGYEEAEIATKLANGSVAKVRARLELLSLPSHAEKAVRAGYIAPTTAIQIQREADEKGIPPAQVQEAIESVIKEKKSNGRTVKASANEVSQKLASTSQKQMGGKEIQAQIDQALSDIRTLTTGFDYPLDVLQKVVKILKKSAGV